MSVISRTTLPLYCLSRYFSRRYTSNKNISFRQFSLTTAHTSQSLPPLSNESGTLPNAKPSAAKAKPKFNITWKSVTVTFIGAGSLLLYMYYLDTKKKQRFRAQQRAHVGKMAIGGPFELITHEKKTVTDKDFHGQWILIYFGFTHCPDICPEELEKLAEVTEILRKKFASSSSSITNKKYPFQPLFVSVDPERDTPELVSTYIKDFSPHFIGLTGTREQVQNMCKHYRVYFSQGPKVGNDYIVDHAIIISLVSRPFVKKFKANNDENTLTNEILNHFDTIKQVQSTYYAKWNLCQDLFSMLSGIVPVVGGCDLIRARVPILRFTDSASRLRCDLNINNVTGIRNTDLLRFYSETDPRVAPLVLSLKTWAKFHNINDASQQTLSSYSLTLMIIYYLQSIASPPVVPVWQQLLPDRFDAKIPCSQLKRNDKPSELWQSQNIQLVGELFIGFLSYYVKQFRFEDYAISVRLGSLLDKEDFLDNDRTNYGNSLIAIEGEYYTFDVSVYCLYLIVSIILF
ncbi:unnamed protein product [Didymodactylos carnosus]|uniref:Uncharacterized protein n=1 Tax=Didymodactylos carnosus TaxID=1234261 RepID=A0A813Q8U2_9BILA|nr:unnamed protein product [Didymodactylos carnosus]CAF0872373.1 unnamed protein product [Didymodactylos carnosus]CAF3544684.1 unnamed protein product [Didymodactylos carnosus]CAF3657198.1 unnamed protein product [Didymodactylos carnosus]